MWFQTDLVEWSHLVISGSGPGYQAGLIMNTNQRRT